MFNPDQLLGQHQPGNNPRYSTTVNLVQARLADTLGLAVGQSSPRVPLPPPLSGPRLESGAWQSIEPSQVIQKEQRIALPGFKELEERRKKKKQAQSGSDPMPAVPVPASPWQQVPQLKKTFLPTPQPLPFRLPMPPALPLPKPVPKEPIKDSPAKQSQKQPQLKPTSPSPAKQSRESLKATVPDLNLQKALQSLREMVQQDNRRSMKLGISLFLLMRLRRWSKRSCKRLKNEKTRYRVFEEMIKNEKGFIKDMTLLQGEVIAPLVDNRFVSQDQKRALFANLDAILSLQKELLGMLEETFAKYDRKKTRISSVFQAFIPFFLIYTQYNNAHRDGDELLRQLRRSRPALNDFVTFKESKVLSETVQSLRIKPVQQVPRYVLLLSAMLKCMDPTHADYKQLEKVLEKLKKINSKNDQNLGREGLKQEAFALEKKFGGILDHNRQYRYRKKGSLLGSKMRPAVLHLFSNLLLVTDDKVQEEYERIQLNQDSVCEVSPEAKYFKNIYFVCGVNCAASFLFPSQNEMAEFHTQASEVLGLLVQKEKDRPLHFSLSQDRHLFPWMLVVRAPFAEQQFRVTQNGEALVYCLEFELLGLRYRNKFTLAEHEANFKRVRQQLNLPKVRLLTDSADAGFIQHHSNSSYIIEFRKLFLQTQVNNLLKASAHREKANRIAYLLGVPLSFQDYAANYDSHGSVHCSVLIERDLFFQRIKQTKQSLAPALLIDQLYYKFRLLPYSVETKTVMPLTVKVYYPQAEGQEHLKLEVDERSRVHAVMLQIKTELHLDYLNDYCLVLAKEGDSRRLDFDERIGDVYKPDESEQPRDGLMGFFDRGLTFVGQLISKDKPRLFLRKMIFLPEKLELALYSGEADRRLQRFRLLVEELFYRMSRGEFNFTLDQLETLVALYLFYKDPNHATLYKRSTLPLERIKKVLSPADYARRSEAEWTVILLEVLGKRKNQLEQLLPKPEQFYRLIVQCFGDYRFKVYDVRKGKNADLVRLVVSPKEVRFEGEKRVEVELKGLTVSWSVHSLFLEHKYIIYRFEAEHPFSIAEDILWMQAAARLSDSIS